MSIVASRNTVINIDNSTLVSDGSNTRGLFSNSGGEINVRNSILSNLSSSIDCEGSSISVDTNTIVEDGSCNATRMGDPGLLPLAFNGGPTQTHALKPDSIAVNTANPSTCTTTDQRGVTRDESCDVGSYELSDSQMNRGDVFVIPLRNRKSVMVEL